MKKKNTDKSLALEHKADALTKKGKHTKAFKYYQQALQHDPDRIELYDKLLAAHSAMKTKWTEEDFVLNLELTMKKQELLNPTFKRIHARHDVDFKKVMQLIQRMMAEKNQEKETEIIENIVSFGEMAIYPLIDTLLAIKQPSIK